MYIAPGLIAWVGTETSPLARTPANRALAEAMPLTHSPPHRPGPCTLSCSAGWGTPHASGATGGGVYIASTPLGPACLRRAGDSVW